MNWLKEGLQEAIGKQIAGIVESGENPYQPRYHAYIVFTDDTYVELYSNDGFQCTSGVRPMDGTIGELQLELQAARDRYSK